MKKQIRTIRRWIIIFIIALILSGATAIPAETELSFVTGLFPAGSVVGDWLGKIYQGLVTTNKEYPFMAYGYDWLAFAHIVLAILFIGPLQNPVRNKWVVEFGMIACLLIIPFALIAGHFREIPFWWRLIDCSFGIIDLVPLGICLRKIYAIESSNDQTYC